MVIADEDSAEVADPIALVTVTLNLNDVENGKPLTVQESVELKVPGAEQETKA